MTRDSLGVLLLVLVVCAIVAGAWIAIDHLNRQFERPDWIRYDSKVRVKSGFYQNAEGVIESCGGGLCSVRFREGLRFEIPMMELEQR